jgi:Na+-driven multidrug efflux pump
MFIALIVFLVWLLGVGTTYYSAIRWLGEDEDMIATSLIWPIMVPFFLVALGVIAGTDYLKGAAKAAREKAKEKKNES